MKFKEGDRITHFGRKGHGAGTIKSIHPKSSLQYEVVFDSGYVDMYTDTDLQPINKRNKKEMEVE